MKTFKEFLGESITLMSHYQKAGKTFTLWSKGQRQYELSSRSQDSSGKFKKIESFDDHNHEDAHAALRKKGYTRIGESVDSDEGVDSDPATEAVAASTEPQT